jgi:hypothetical protein
MNATLTLARANTSSSPSRTQCVSVVTKGWLNKGTKTDYKENIWTRKRRRILENTSKQGDTGHIKGESIAKLIKSLQLRWYSHVERMKRAKHAKTNCNRYN